MAARSELPLKRGRLAIGLLCALGVAGCVGPGLEPPGKSGGGKEGFGNMDTGTAGSGGTAGTSVGSAGSGASGVTAGSGAAGTGSSNFADAGAMPQDEDGGVLDDASVDAGEMP